MEVIINLSYPPQLQEEHKDPYVLDQDNNKIQQSFENKSCSKSPKNMFTWNKITYKSIGKLDEFKKWKQQLYMLNFDSPPINMLAILSEKNKKFQRL